MIGRWIISGCVDTEGITPQVIIRESTLEERGLYEGSLGEEDINMEKGEERK